MFWSEINAPCYSGHKQMKNSSAEFQIPVLSVFSLEVKKKGERQTDRSVKLKL